MSGPLPLKPEDDWVRGNQIELGRRISEADPDDSPLLWEQLYLGQAAMSLMRGVATRQEIAKVMGYVIAQCEMDVQQGARDLLAMPDTGSEAYRTLHFNTRVSAGVLNRINQLVRDGQAAADQIEQQPHQGE